MSKPLKLFPLCTLILYSISFSDAQAVDYTFTKIADTSVGLSTIYTPVLNENGDMVFSAERSGGGQVLYNYSGGLLTTVVETTGDDYINGYGLNDNGTVAYGLGFEAGGEVIKTVSGGITTEIINTDGVYDSFGVYSINNNDVVLFNGSLDELTPTNEVQSGIYTIDGGVVTTIADSGAFHGLFGESMNNNDLVAFASFDGLYTGSGGPITTIADESGMFSSFDTTSINDDGVVSFRATLDAGGAGIYTYDGGTIATVADTSGLFSGFGDSSINSNGDVVFNGGHTDVGGGGITVEGLYTGSDPLSDFVIERGAVIDGDLLLFFGVSPYAINDSGQIAFQAEFTDESGQGIYLATPTAVPLPASVWFFISGLVGLFGLSRRKAA